MAFQPNGTSRDAKQAENLVSFIRVKPLHNNETSVLQVDDDATVTVRGRDHTGQQYNVDHVFPATASQLDVWNKARGFVDAILEGLNSTVLAYGLAGSGTTHTILGTGPVPRLSSFVLTECSAVVDSEDLDSDPYNLPPDLGLFPRAVHRIFCQLRLNQQSIQYSVYLSCLEISNDMIYDLLDIKRMDNQGQLVLCPLDIIEDKFRGPQVMNLSHVIVSSAEEAFTLLRQAFELREQIRERSKCGGRSHAMYTITVDQKPLLIDSKDKVYRIRSGRLRMVDLAGHDSISSASAESVFSTPELRVSKSLSSTSPITSLDSCVRLLTQQHSGRFSFRSSQLTRLLQGSLQGNSKTLLIATVSGSQTELEDTCCTLRIAEDARKISLYPVANDILDEVQLVRRHEREISRLKQLLNVFAGGSENADIAVQIASLDEENVKLKETVLRLNSDLYYAVEERRQMLRPLQVEEDDSVKDDSVSREDMQQEIRRLRKENALLRDRFERLQGLEEDCSSRKAELHEYLRYLKSIEVRQQDSSSSVSMKDRLALMEWSAVMQSKELQRTKETHIQEVRGLQNELQKKTLALSVAEEQLRIQKEKLAQIMTANNSIGNFSPKGLSSSPRLSEQVPRRSPTSSTSTGGLAAIVESPVPSGDETDEPALPLVLVAPAADKDRPPSPPRTDSRDTTLSSDLSADLAGSAGSVDIKPLATVLREKHSIVPPLALPTSVQVPSEETAVSARRSSSPPPSTRSEPPPPQRYPPRDQKRFPEITTIAKTEEVRDTPRAHSARYLAPAPTSPSGRQAGPVPSTVVARDTPRAHSARYLTVNPTSPTGKDAAARTKQQDDGERRQGKKAVEGRVVPATPQRAPKFPTVASRYKATPAVVGKANVPSKLSPSTPAPRAGSAAPAAGSGGKVPPSTKPTASRAAAPQASAAEAVPKEEFTRPLGDLERTDSMNLRDKDKFTDLAMLSLSRLSRPSTGSSCGSTLGPSGSSVADLPERPGMRPAGSAGGAKTLERSASASRVGVDPRSNDSRARKGQLHSPTCVGLLTPRDDGRLRDAAHKTLSPRPREPLSQRGRRTDPKAAPSRTQDAQLPPQPQPQAATVAVSDLARPTIEVESKVKVNPMDREARPLLSPLDSIGSRMLELVERGRRGTNFPDDDDDIIITPRTLKTHALSSGPTSPVALSIACDPRVASPGQELASSLPKDPVALPMLERATSPRQGPSSTSPVYPSDAGPSHRSHTPPPHEAERPMSPGHAARTRAVPSPRVASQAPSQLKKLVSPRSTAASPPQQPAAAQARPSPLGILGFLSKVTTKKNLISKAPPPSNPTPPSGPANAPPQKPQSNEAAPPTQSPAGRGAEVQVPAKKLGMKGLFRRQQ